MQIKPASEAWYAQVKEAILDPEQRIIDPHHHLWLESSFTKGKPYLLKEFWDDTQSGHRIEKTVFVECNASYYETGPEYLRPVGETEFVARLAKESNQANGKPVIAGIVARADLRQLSTLERLLEAHEQAAEGLFRGIRHTGANRNLTTDTNLFISEDFKEGVRRLGNLSYSYESFHFHYQLKDFYTVAKSAPNTTIIVNHLGTPLGIDEYANQKETVFKEWQKDITALAELPNVYMKLGGMALPATGFGWHEADKPVSSDELVKAQQHYYLHAIEAFGVKRCMFESNFPVDKLSVSYHVLWNGFKKIVQDFSDTEKDALFYGTAEQVYKLDS